MAHQPPIFNQRWRGWTHLQSVGSLPHRTVHRWCCRWFMYLCRTTWNCKLIV